MTTEMNAEPIQDSWLSIGEACRILGVSEATLRQWTDDGKIKVFITPGGHRRYKRSQLEEFMISRRKTLGIADLVAKLEETAEPHREVALNITSALSDNIRLNQQQRSHLASLGRSILELIIQFVSSPASREETVQKAQEIGRDFGITMSDAGLTLTESIEAFTCHRRPTVEGVMVMMKQKEIIAEEILAALPLIDDIMDRTLVAMVEAYQYHSNP
ncbi:MAG: helix-turn-helix domain-containing protein [Dehalococcoidales bacterium]|jgi:excisionase family DNA binding protein|nr:helix-turn-helix domain-containing protein [Dehalococcoidales bacterium]MDD4229913.1 helix-turn-helix domain-containing protein [Dehalococcoidales bacterium]MDD4465806.1 helix-turn-helix domain-containing protein [Dehalococcoidales bacterium]MDD5402060.1 helix-turn-helix domain-containing protein [Dehalococcoidales bacterium]